MSNPYNIQNISGDKIGGPVPSFSDELDEGYIWLEGAEVSKTAYSKLYEVYGDTYGNPINPENFVLPDCRGRVLWGSPDGTFGYLEASIPNIKGTTTPSNSSAPITGSFYRSPVTYGTDTGALIQLSGINFDASLSDPAYQDGAPLRPASIKCRVMTRYK